MVAEGCTVGVLLDVNWILVSWIGKWILDATEVKRYSWRGLLKFGLGLPAHKRREETRL